MVEPPTKQNENDSSARRQERGRAMAQGQGGLLVRAVRGAPAVWGVEEWGRRRLRAAAGPRTVVVCYVCDASQQSWRSNVVVASGYGFGFGLLGSFVLDYGKYGIRGTGQVRPGHYPS